MAFFGFDIGDFDSYGDYFKDDSYMILAETGEYTGVSGIEEYVKFVFAEFSPYFATNNVLAEELTYLGYEDGQCVFATVYDTDYVMNGSVTRGSDEYRAINMVKLYYDYQSRYISKIFVYYTKDYISSLFRSMLNSDNTQKYICDTITGPCDGFITEPPVDCLSELAMLPGTTENSHVDGDSQGCRALHTALANVRPDVHCAHISLVPKEDSTGSIKCQTSALTEPEDLFDERDFQLFADFCKARGIDPNIGHTYERPALEIR